MSYIDEIEKEYSGGLSSAMRSFDGLVKSCTLVDSLRAQLSEVDKILGNRGHDVVGAAKDLVQDLVEVRARLAVADAAQAAAREEPADLKLVREGCKEVAADVIKAVERRYGDGFGVPANLKTEITTIIAANLWTGHTDAERFVSEQAIADLTTRCASLISSLEKICASNIDMTFMRDIANAALAAALHPATKEGKA